MDSVAEEKFSNLPLEINSLPRYEEVSLHSLAPKYLLKLNIATTISLFFVVGGLAVAYVVFVDFRQYVLLGILFFFIVFGWSYFSNFQLMKRNGYAVRERDIIFRRGFLFERTTVVPFNRVQHVSVERGVTDKLLNLSTLKIFTAGGSGSDVRIPGLLPETAASLKGEISERISRHA